MILTFVTIMKKIITYIISFTAILIFLASSSGISYVIHHCNTAHTDHVLLFAHNYKCSTETEKEHTASSCCCEKHAAASEDVNLKHFNQSECCKNINGSYKTSTDYTVSRYKSSFSFSLVSFDTPYFFTSKIVFHTAVPIFESPPLYRSGQELLCLHSQFRI